MKNILDEALYKSGSKDKLSDSELTELIMMSGYLHHFSSDLKEKKCSKNDLENINDMLERIREIEEKLV